MEPRRTKAKDAILLGCLALPLSARSFHAGSRGTTWSWRCTHGTKVSNHVST